MKLFNGRQSNQYDVVIVTDFRKLNPDNFCAVHGKIVNIKKENILCANDGRLFVNKRTVFSGFLHDMLEILTRESIDTLQQYEEEYKKQFTDIKTFDDWKFMQDTNENKIHAIAMLCVPIEIKRREIASEYFDKSTYKNN